MIVNEIAKLEKPLHALLRVCLYPSSASRCSSRFGAETLLSIQPLPSLSFPGSREIKGLSNRPMVRREPRSELDPCQWAGAESSTRLDGISSRHPGTARRPPRRTRRRPGPTRGRDHQPQLQGAVRRRRRGGGGGGGGGRGGGRPAGLRGPARGAERAAGELAARAGIGPAVVAMLDDPP